MWISLILPLLGTALGAGAVLGVPMGSRGWNAALAGAAAGAMLSSGCFGLLLPALETGRLWAMAGFALGLLGLLLPERFASSRHSPAAALMLAVVLHNIPEGMAVGVLYAGWSTGAANVSLAAALTLSLGIALQNFPEGAIVSMPLRGDGVGRGKAFGLGTLSGAVEPIAALITILLAEWIAPALPYLLGFAAGAMMYVVVEELIPEMSEGEHSNIGTLCFAAGFTAMIILDVLLG